MKQLVVITTSLIAAAIAVQTPDSLAWMQMQPVVQTTIRASDEGGSGVVEQVCNSVRFAADRLCSTSVKIPVSASVETRRACTNKCCSYSCGQQRCTTKFCTWNCGQKKCLFGACVNIPCSGRSKQHCGEACVDIPCTGCVSRCGQICTNIPHALRIRYDEQTLCDLIPVASMAADAARLCPCLKELSGLRNLKSGSADFIRVAGAVLECFVDAGLKPESTRDAVVATLESSNDYIIMAPEVGLELYASLTAAIAGCVSSGTTCDAIGGVLFSYLEDVVEKVADEFGDFWSELFVDRVYTPIRSQFDELMSTVRELPTRLATELETCTAEVRLPRDLLRNVERNFERIADAGEGAIEEAEEFREKISGFIDSFKAALAKVSSDYPELIAEAVEDGKIPSFEDPIELITKVKEIESSAQDFKEFADTIKSSFMDIQSLVGTLQELKAQLRAAAEECTSAFDRVVGDLEAQMEKFPDILESILDLDIDANTVQAGIVSYQMSLRVSVNLPCSRMKRKSFKIGSLTAVSTDFPEFYACPYSTTVPLPNRHIPYMRLKNLKRS